LIADKKAKYPDGSFDYQEKLFDRLGHIIYGSAGKAGMYRFFVDTVFEYVRTHPGDITFENAVLKLSEIASDIYRRYGFNQDYYFELLVAVIPDHQKSYLTYITGHGMSYPIHECYSIGSGKKYASIFLKSSYRTNMTMEQAAELGYFTIKYIEDFELETNVGVNDDIPQMWFVPDRDRNLNNDYQITNRTETQLILDRIQNNANRRLKMHRNHLKRLFAV
jgi:20S proteasome alpha/beta subunit